MSISLPTLPYAMNELEPYMSRATLTAHFTHHHAQYVEKTNALTEGTSLASASLEQIVLASVKNTRKSLFNAAAQAWNHSFLWPSMRANGGGEPRGAIAKLIERDFGSSRAFRDQFALAATDQFGSGWAWLVLDSNALRIVATPDAATPLTTAQIPLLTLDIWEHAYYLDYQYRRSEYIAAFLDHLVNWDFAARNLQSALDLAHPKPPHHESIASASRG